jgi:hypothetical protein
MHQRDNNVLQESVPFAEHEYIQLVPSDAVNRNKVSIRQLPLFYFYSLHVSALTGHPQVRYTIKIKNKKGGVDVLKLCCN